MTSLYHIHNIIYIYIFARSRACENGQHLEGVTLQHELRVMITPTEGVEVSLRGSLCMARCMPSAIAVQKRRYLWLANVLGHMILGAQDGSLSLNIYIFVGFVASICPPVSPRLLSMTTASFQDRFLSGFSGRSILLHTGFSRVETSQMM